MSEGKYDQASAQARTRARAQAPVQEVFHQGETVHSFVSLNGLKFRESRDSANHPNSIALAILMDVTGSMGTIPEDLVKRTLPKFMKLVLPYEPDAQLLCGGFKDYSDQASDTACQIGQWECDDALIDKCLTSLSLGGGNRPHEDSAIALYVMARHTQIDCWEKRGKKGYIFLPTDDTMRPMVQARTVNALFGRRVLEKDLSTAEMIRELTERYHVFVFIPDPGRVGYDGRGTGVFDCYREYFGRNVIVLGASVDTAIVAAMLVALTEGHLPNLDAVDVELEMHMKMAKGERDRILKALEPYVNACNNVA